MTNIRIVYNPFEERTFVYNEQTELSAMENKICTFLNCSPFPDCLRPIRKRYLIWEGLLPELVCEVNDDELEIIFEGRTEDFQLVSAAFEDSAGLLPELGYENRWKLTHAGNFETAHIAGTLSALARDLREMCESRAELAEVDRFLRLQGNPDVDRDILADMLARHMEKWKNSGSPYTEEKILYLQLLVDRLNETENHSHTGRALR